MADDLGEKSKAGAVGWIGRGVGGESFHRGPRGRARGRCRRGRAIVVVEFRSRAWRGTCIATELRDFQRA